MTCFKLVKKEFFPCSFFVPDVAAYKHIKLSSNSSSGVVVGKAFISSFLTDSIISIKFYLKVRFFILKIDIIIFKKLSLNSSKNCDNTFVLHKSYI